MTSAERTQMREQMRKQPHEQPRVRVLHIVANLNYGGMERIIAEIVRRTDPSRFESHVMALQYLGHFSEGLAPYATLHLMRQPMNALQRLEHRLSMVRPTTLAQDIRAVAPAIVHLHSGVWYKASLAARMADVPIVIYTDHGRQNPDPWIYRTIDARASRRTDRVVAVSDALAAHMRTFVADPSRVQVIRNGVDTERYDIRPSSGALHRELGFAADVPIIGSVGRLEPVKGYEVLVEAFSILVSSWNSQQGPAPVLVVIGDGSERSKLEALAHRLHVSDRLKFLGWRSDIEEALHEFALFTMSSHSEGTSVSLLEAMSSGLCPVVTNVGGNSAVLDDDLCHRLVPPANPAALAHALRSAVVDTAARTKDSQLARARVLKLFALDSMVHEYQSLYDALYQSLPQRMVQQSSAVTSP